MEENNKGILSLIVTNKAKPYYIIFYSDSLVVVRLDPNLKRLQVNQSQNNIKLKRCLCSKEARLKAILGRLC